MTGGEARGAGKQALLDRLDAAVHILWDADRLPSGDPGEPNSPEESVWQGAAMLASALRKDGDLIRGTVWAALLEVPSRAALEALAAEWERRGEYCDRAATAYPDLGDGLLGEAAGARNAAERLRGLLAEQTGDEGA